MVSGININDNNVIASLSRQAQPAVFDAIKGASRKTGVDFAYLLQQAKAESSFDTKAKASTSSAAGLYQFIESTWMQMVKDHGHKYGLGHYASQINHDGSVNNTVARREILDLRFDPKIASELAAEFASQNKKYLETHLNEDYGDIGPTELYFAHFLGASGATGFLNALHENPLQAAANIFPAAARANRNVFYDSQTGEARTLAGVYEFFDKKFGGGDHQTQIALGSTRNKILAYKQSPIDSTRFARQALDASNYQNLLVTIGSASNKNFGRMITNTLGHGSFRDQGHVLSLAYLQEPTISLARLLRAEADR